MKFLKILDQINANTENKGALYNLLPPITEAEQKELLTVFGSDFPQDLLSLCRECNGIEECMKIEGTYVHTHDLVWSSTRLVREHQQNMPLIPNKVFFADAGNGDSFCIDTQTQAIFVWYAIENKSCEIAKTLDTFLEKWIVGEIKI